MGLAVLDKLRRDLRVLFFVPTVIDKAVTAVVGFQQVAGKGPPS